MTEVLTYEALKAEPDALAVESFGLRHIAERIVNALYAAGYEPVENSLHPWESLIFDAEKALNAPSTDAALAAIKKQAGIEAVEEAAYSLYGKGYIFDTIMGYATELREAK